MSPKLSRLRLIEEKLALVHMLLLFDPTVLPQSQALASSMKEALAVVRAEQMEEFRRDRQTGTRVSAPIPPPENLRGH